MLLYFVLSRQGWENQGFGHADFRLEPRVYGIPGAYRLIVQDDAKTPSICWQVSFHPGKVGLVRGPSRSSGWADYMEKEGAGGISMHLARALRIRLSFW